MANPYKHLAGLIGEDRPVALAVVLEARGSAPQGAGASAIFSSRKLVEGTVGGGALEAAVFREARAALRSGRPEIVSLAMKGTSLHEEEPVCGGDVRVLIDPRPGKDARVFSALASALERGRRGVLATSIVEGKNGLISLTRDWIPADSRSSLDRRIVAAMADGKPLLRKAVPSRPIRGSGSTRLFLEPVVPPARLIIAGAGHIGRAVAHLGRLLDFEVTVIDDRSEFANRRNIPDADTIFLRDIGTALRNLRIDGETYIVIVTRGHRNDADALRACIPSGAGYIGMIGSRSKIALARREFIARKWATAREFDRVHAPIGLPIRSETVQEIAISVAAELVLARRQNAAGEGPRR
jgi:xanthine dehydrogenase accessory factor